MPLHNLSVAQHFNPTVIPAKVSATSFPRRRESKGEKHYPERPDTSFPRRTTSTSFPRRRESTFYLNVIPAKAGIQRGKTLSRATRHIIPAQDYLNVIPAKAGIHIPAYAGIHRPIPPTPEKNTLSFPRRRESKGKNTIQSIGETHHSRAGIPQRHSRALGGGIHGFPRMRE